MFADDMILYVEDLKDATRKLLQLNNKFGKVEGYKNLISRNLFHFYTITTKYQKQKLGK